MNSAEYDKWISENPVRKFRINNDISRIRLANHLGLSMNTVQFWENGTSKPKDENLEKIAIVMGISSDKLNAEWNDWLDREPGLKIGGD